MNKNDLKKLKEFEDKIDNLRACPRIIPRIFS